MIRQALHGYVLSALVYSVSAPAGGFDRAVETLLPRVVKLYGLTVGTQAGYGTGTLVSPEGLILTVNSLLIDARRVRVVTWDGTMREAEVVRRDAERELALLRLVPPADAPAATLPFFDLACGPPADEAPPALRPGDWLVVAGNPFKVAEGSEPVSIAHGVYSARTRLDARRGVKDCPYRGEVLVIDAITSNPGAPGSAVVDLDGRFVGMIGREVKSNLTHTHFNYAMPRDVLCDFLLEPVVSPTRSAQAKNRDDAGDTASGSPPAVDPGIRLTRTGYRKLPPMVERVRRGSPAEHAGVQPDDVILSVNGKSVADPDEYDERLRSARPGEPIDLVLRRGRTIVSVRIEPEKPK